MHGILELRPERGPELGGSEKLAQHRGDVAVARAEGRSEPLHQHFGRVVGDEEERKLPADEARRGRVPREQIERLVHFGRAAPADGAPEQQLVAIVMASRDELRHFAVEVDAEAGEDACELLHVALGVAAVYAERVQLHQLAGVVLVDPVGGVLRVVQVDEHRRVQRRRAEQIAEAPERVRPDGALLVVRHQHPQVRLVLEDVEVVHPEPGHLLAQLPRRVEGPQQHARGRLASEARELLLVRLLRRLLLLVAAQEVQALPAALHFLRELFDRAPGDGHRVHLCLDLWRQRCLLRGPELRFQVALRPHAGELARGRGIRAPGHAIEEKKILGAQAGLRGTARSSCARRNKQKQKRAAGPIHRPHRMTFLRGPDLHSTTEGRKGELFYCFNL